MGPETIDLLRSSYNALLGRDPDPTAEASWAATAKDGAALQDMMLRIIQSPEFATRWQSDIARPAQDDWRDFFRDHSQFGEVALLVRQMVDRSAVHRIVVDVGANGRARSNSFDLMRSFGWKGLLIEANPGRIPIIEAEFAGLDFRLVNCAVSDYTGEAVLHLGSNDDISSLSAEATGSWGPVRGGVTVAVRPLPAILSEHEVPEDFDVLSVDAEGEDVRIVNAALSEGYRPRWVILEAGSAESDVGLGALGFVEAVTARYEIVGRTVANLILARV